MPAASRETFGSAGLARFAARAADAGEVFFGGAVREYGAHGQEHRVVLGFLAVLQHVLELRGFPAHVVDNRVDDDVVGLAEFGHVIPGTQARVHLGVVDRSIGRQRQAERRSDAGAAQASGRPAEVESAVQLAERLQRR